MVPRGTPNNRSMPYCKKPVLSEFLVHVLIYYYIFIIASCIVLAGTFYLFYLCLPLRFTLPCVIAVVRAKRLRLF